MDYKQNETVTITLERYEELKERLDVAEKLCKDLKECFDVFSKQANFPATTETTFIRTDTAKKQIEKVAACLGYKCADNVEQENN